MLSQISRPEPAATTPAELDSRSSSPEPAAAPSSGALRSPAAHARFWLVAIGGLTLDLWSKDWAFQHHRDHVLIPYVLEFQTVLNPGALFGIGAGFTNLFLAASLLALLLVLWMFSQSAANRWLFHIALGGILAGALGNMHDRINVKLLKDPLRQSRYWAVSEPAADGSRVLTEFPQRGVQPLQRTVSPEQWGEYPAPVGYVRDFIKIPTRVAGRDLWPWVFNVADMLLVGGVAILAVGLWTERRPEPASPANPEAQSAATAQP